jgi:hypothetical protein
MPTSVYALASSDTQANEMVQAFRNAGFRVDDISVLYPDNSTSSRDFGHEKNTKAPEGAVAGGTTGAVVGGALGWMAGIGLLAIPGIGPFIAAGPIMALLGGAALGGAVGGITGSLIGLGIPEYEAKRYEGKIRKGRILISVHADNSEWADKAKAIFRDQGAEDIGSSSEASAESESPVGNHPNSGSPSTRSSGTSTSGNVTGTGMGTTTAAGDDTTRARY